MKEKASSELQKKLDQYLEEKLTIPYVFYRGSLGTPMTAISIEFCEWLVEN